MEKSMRGAGLDMVCILRARFLFFLRVSKCEQLAHLSRVHPPILQKIKWMTMLLNPRLQKIKLHRLTYTLVMNIRYYVPVFEGIPKQFTNGTVAFNNARFPPADEFEPVSVHATVPVFWIAIQPVSQLVYQSKYFVVLGEFNTVVDHCVPGEIEDEPALSVKLSILKSQPRKNSFFSKLLTDGVPFTVLIALAMLIGGIERCWRFKWEIPVHTKTLV